MSNESTERLTKLAQRGQMQSIERTYQRDLSDLRWECHLQPIAQQILLSNVALGLDDVPLPQGSAIQNKASHFSMLRHYVGDETETRLSAEPRDGTSSMPGVGSARLAQGGCANPRGRAIVLHRYTCRARLAATALAFVRAQALCERTDLTTADTARPDPDWGNGF
jgi:hypothetical protein